MTDRKTDRETEQNELNLIITIFKNRTEIRKAKTNEHNEQTTNIGISLSYYCGTCTGVLTRCIFNVMPFTMSRKQAYVIDVTYFKVTWLLLPLADTG